jgi:hypothetical protein
VPGVGVEVLPGDAPAAVVEHVEIVSGWLS